MAWTIFTILLPTIVKADVLMKTFAEVAQRDADLKQLLGPYKFYIYEGGAFDAISTDLLATHKCPVENEYRAPVWVHRALQVDPSRTLDPAEADLFFVPAYPQMSRSAGAGAHEARLKAWADALRASEWYVRSGGRDHVFAAGDVNPGYAGKHGYQHIMEVLHGGFTGTFEMNPAWVGGDAWPKANLIAMPYVMNDDIVKVALAEDMAGDPAALAAAARHRRHVSLYFAASRRPNAVGWANCSRAELNKLAGYPHAVVHVSGRKRRRRRRLLAESSRSTTSPGDQRGRHPAYVAGEGSRRAATGVGLWNASRALRQTAGRSALRKTDGGGGGGGGEARSREQQSKRYPRESRSKPEGQRRLQQRHSEGTFADHMRGSVVCPLMCGDTPSSRRTFDAYASGCVPVLVGTRLWGRCDPPCKPGWGWRVSGVAFPHLPFHGLWLDWSRFPLLDELALVSGDADGAVALMRRALGPVAAAAGGDLTEGLARVRAYQLATRRHLMYGSGDCRVSSTFGRAPRRLMEAALFRLRGHVKPEHGDLKHPRSPPIVELPRPPTSVAGGEGEAPTSASSAEQLPARSLTETLAAIEVPYPEVVRKGFEREKV